MASRKKTTQDMLIPKPAGWQDQIGEAEPQPKAARGKLKRKTYLMTDDLIAKIEDFAAEYNVGVNEALRFIVIAGLDSIKTGNAKVKTQVVTKNTLGV